MKFAKPRIVAKKMQLFECSRVLLARGYLGLVSLGKHVFCDAFALIILQAQIQLIYEDAERPDS